MLNRFLLGGLAALAAATVLPTPASADPPWARERYYERRGDYDRRGGYDRYERQRWREHHGEYRPGYYRPPPPVYYAPPPRPYYPPPGVYIPFR